MYIHPRVPLCVCMHILTDVFVHVCAPTGLRVCVNLPVHVCLCYAHTSVCACTRMCVPPCVHAHPCACVCAYTCAHPCACVHTHVHIHMSAHTQRLCAHVHAHPWGCAAIEEAAAQPAHPLLAAAPFRAVRGGPWQRSPRELAGQMGRGSCSGPPRGSRPRCWQGAGCTSLQVRGERAGTLITAQVCSPSGQGPAASHGGCSRTGGTSSRSPPPPQDRARSPRSRGAPRELHPAP